MSGQWIHTDWCSRRITRRFAWMPTNTIDAGWIWLRRYWLRENIFGWGFHDRHPFINKPELF